MCSRQVATVFALLLTACNFGKSDDQSRPLPTPEPSSTTPATRPAEQTAPAPARPKEPERTGPTPTVTATATTTAEAPKPGATPTTTPTSTSKPDAGSTAPTPAPLPTLPTLDAGSPISASCLPKCQANLSACIAKPVALDAGFPSLESMSACKKLFEDCRTACTP